jgi:hypothetical protein
MRIWHKDIGKEFKKLFSGCTQSRIFCCLFVIPACPVASATRRGENLFDGFAEGFPTRFARGNDKYA